MSIQSFEIEPKHSQIAGKIRAQIVDGAFPPGSRLPTFDELEGRFQTCRVTLRQAMDRLQQEGFIHSIERRGTFIVERPPHLYRYALVFPSQSDSGRWHRFWSALVSEATRADQTAQRNIPVFYGVDGHADNPQYDLLLKDIRLDRFAGLIFATVADELLQTSLFTENPRMPRFVLTPRVWTPASQGKPVAPNTFPYAETDNAALIRRALEWLKSRGRKRVALICTPRMSERTGWLDQVRDQGLSTRSTWLHELSVEWPLAAKNIVELMLHHQDPAERPDGLVVANDNFVEHACAGLVNSRRDVGHDLDVVVHCNWPYPVPSILPVKRVGFDARQMLQWALDYIDKRRTGHDVSNVFLAPPLFEDEVRINN